MKTKSTLIFLFCCFALSSLNAQDYRLIAASHYKQGTLMDSVHVRYSWHRQEAPRSMVLFYWTSLNYELSNSQYDTMIKIYSSGSPIREYSYRQFDFLNNETTRTDSSYDGFFYRTSTRGYGSDSLIQTMEAFYHDQQIWKVNGSTETVKKGNLTESIKYEHPPIGKTATFRERVYHNPIENSDSLIRSTWDSQLSDWQSFGSEVRYYDSAGRVIKLVKSFKNGQEFADIQEWDFFPNGLQRSFKYTYLVDGQIQSNYSQVSKLNVKGNYDTIETRFYTRDTLSNHHLSIYSYDQQDRIIKIEKSSVPDPHPFEYFAFTYLNATDKIKTVEIKGVSNPDVFTNHYYYETFNNNVSLKPVMNPQELILYPNPVRNSFSFITEEKNAPFSLHIYDLKGNLCMEMSGEQLGNQIDLSPALANGLYTYRLETAEKAYSGRIQIQR